jgi:3-deoxy-manno-octulosonate cytidylyltransferase (CMP-KDO synthetase)
LADLLGKPMVQHVWERSRAADCLDEVLVATDDQRVFDIVARSAAMQC